jgi:colanic acid/amylovoran biosynthesis glycosyltransferase
MRVVLAVIQFPKLSETFIVTQFHGLLNHGIDVHICCDRSNESEWNAFPALKANSDARKRVHLFWPYRPKWFALLCFLPALFASLAKNPSGTLRYFSKGFRKFGFSIFKKFYLDSTLISLKPDVIHFEFGAQALGKMHLKELLDCKVVVSFRGYDLNYTGLEKEGYFSEVFEKSDVLHLLGNDLWRRAQKRGCSAERPHVLIPPAIDASFFAPGNREHSEVTGTRERPLRILSVGRLEWKKGYAFSVQAVQILKLKGIHCEYRVIGEGRYVESIAFLRGHFGLEDSIKLMGALPPAQVKEQMLWADVFLHSSVSEGFGNAVMEAQAMKLPVVCSDADGLSENVLDNVTGFVVPRRNSQVLADKLSLLSKDPALRQQMGDAGRQRVQTHFQTGDQIDAFRKVYEDLMVRVSKTEPV